MEQSIGALRKLAPLAFCRSCYRDWPGPLCAVKVVKPRAPRLLHPYGMSSRHEPSQRRNPKLRSAKPERDSVLSTRRRLARLGEEYDTAP